MMNDSMIQAMLENTDERVNSGKPVTPAFLLAVLLWHPLQEATKALRQEGVPPLPALEQAMGDVISKQVKIIGIPKRFSKVMREIWLLQYRLPRRYGRRPMRLLEHPRFRAGYDFLALRVAANEESEELLTWWTEFQEADEMRQAELLQQVQKGKPRRRRRKKA
jgi:poly(A) polymerase